MTTLLPTTNPEIEIGTNANGQYAVPPNVTGELNKFLNKVRQVTPVRDSNLAELAIEFDGDARQLEEKYKPSHVKDDFWRVTKDLMLHMNTTQIAMRSFQAVYNGSQTRRITGDGNHVDDLNNYANSPEYKAAATLHFQNAVLFGTSCATPTYDDETDCLDSIIHDPVRTHLYTDPANVKRVLAMVEFDQANRFMRFQTREAWGVLRPKNTDPRDITILPAPAPWLPVSIAYGDDRRSVGDRYGRSRVRQTPGFNRILTNAYFALGLLIKWQSRSLLVISGGDTGGEAALPKKFAQVNGNTAVLVSKDGKAEFISPNAKFSEILEVISSYLTFLAVSIGLPKSVFLPQDNVSAQSARLEGAPLISTLRGMARAFELFETDFLMRAAGVLHMRHREMLTMRELRAKYQISVRLDPWDYTDDLPTTAGTLVNLVSNGLMRLTDAIRRVNPELTDDEVEELILKAQPEQVSTLVS